MHVRIIRKLESLKYLRDPGAPFDWHNNDGNNALDSLEVFEEDGTLAIRTSVQTIANMEGLDPGVHFSDTIVPGKFSLRYGVDPRSFRCQPFGIVGATTRNGDLIIAEIAPEKKTAENDSAVPEEKPAANQFASGKPTENDSTTATNKSRWLVHDRKDHIGVDTRVCWSAGCVVFQDNSALEAFNLLCATSGLKPGDLIPAELFEEVDD